MKAQTVITHAPTQGVTLRKVTDRGTPAPVHAPAMIHRPTVIIAGHPCWSRVWETPRAEVMVWIADAITQGDYAYAADLSAYAHGPAPALPDGVVVLPTY